MFVLNARDLPVESVRLYRSGALYPGDTHQHPLRVDVRSSLDGYVSLTLEEARRLHDLLGSALEHAASVSAEATGWVLSLPFVEPSVALTRR